jgi:hypothetical protein
MTVRRRTLAGSVVDLNHGGIQVFTIQPGQRVRQRDARSFFGTRVLGRAGNLSPCRRTSNTAAHRIITASLPILEAFMVRSSWSNSRMV